MVRKVYTISAQKSGDVQAHSIATLVSAPGHTVFRVSLGLPGVMLCPVSAPVGATSAATLALAYRLWRLHLLPHQHIIENCMSLGQSIPCQATVMRVC